VDDRSWPQSDHSAALRYDFRSRPIAVGIDSCVRYVMPSSDQETKNSEESLEHARRRIDGRRERTARRRENLKSPMFPALAAAYATYFSFQFVEYHGTAILIGVFAGWAVGAYCRLRA
jgi:hypothetical protein